MSKLLELMKQKPLTLIVYLPENTVEMAKAAEKEGADALIIGESSFAEDILNAVSIPVGLDVAKKDIKSIADILKLKFDFINFHHTMIPEYSNIDKIKIVALDDHYTLDNLMAMPDKHVDAINAAVVPIHHLGRELLVGDLQNYIAITLSASIPVIVPTQRNIKTSEVPIIWDTGAKGLLLTEVILGKTVKSLSKILKEYRIAVDSIDAS